MLAVVIGRLGVGIRCNIFPYIELAVHDAEIQHPDDARAGQKPLLPVGYKFSLHIIPN